VTAFTSLLSTPEFLLVREAGFRPLRQVMGTCFYNVGWQGLPYGLAGWGIGQTVELETQTEAWNEARRLAVERLLGEARAAGADAVVGVDLRRGTYDWAAGVIEFVATGTAVASDRYDLGSEPVLSNLSGQEFAQLVRSGFWPAGIVAGTTVCYVAAGWRQQNMSSMFGGGWLNQELPDFTQGLYDARTQAMLRLERQAHELGASGVVGVTVNRHEREVEVNNTLNLIVTMHVLGTAIVEVERTAGDPPVYTALRLNEENR
jgi:uncharacterized protein YbjQ (UPF0145 family)